MPANLRPADIRSLLAVFEKFPAVRSVALFGSRAKGLTRRTSDIDLAIDAPDISDHDYATLAELLENLPVIHAIDLVRMDRLPAGSLRDAIIRKGLPLFSGATVTRIQ